MENRKKVQKYFRNKYYNQNDNYKAILSEIKKDERMNQNKILKIISTIIWTLVGTTSVVFASTQIHNQYIKEQNNTQSREIFDNGTGISSYETDLSQNDMALNESCTLYHKVITNMEDYNKYKTRIKELPEMSEETFNENFLLVVADRTFRQWHERDLMIADVIANETTTYIIMKQKENPNYDNENNICYAIVDKTQLRENIETKIEHKKIYNPNFVGLKELPDDYSVEEALNDGCFVEDKNKILSDNIYAIDEFIEKTENNEKAFIRIYSKNDFDTKIVDVEYNGKIITLNTMVWGKKDIHVMSSKYIFKGNKKANNLVRYFLTDEDIFEKKSGRGIPLIAIYQE